MNVIIENTIKQLGYRDIEAFVRNKLTDTLMKDIVKYKSIILSFEKKYQMGFYEFEEKYFSNEAKEDFKKWDDNISWEASVHSFNKAEQLLETLQDEGLTSYNQQRSEFIGVNEKAGDYYKNLQKKNNGIHNLEV